MFFGMVGKRAVTLTGTEATWSDVYAVHATTNQMEQVRAWAGKGASAGCMAKKGLRKGVHATARPIDKRGAGTEAGSARCSGLRAGRRSDECYLLTTSAQCSGRRGAVWVVKTNLE